MEKKLKLDLEAKSFSSENALYFAELSTIAYKPKDAAESMIQGMGFDRFHWFEVGVQHEGL